MVGIELAVTLSKLFLQSTTENTQIIPTALGFGDTPSMPVRKTAKGKYKWGSKGKEYPTKKQAEKQGRAAYASGYKKSKGK